MSTVSRAKAIAAGQKVAPRTNPTVPHFVRVAMGEANYWKLVQEEATKLTEGKAK